MNRDGSPIYGTAQWYRKKNSKNKTNKRRSAALPLAVDVGKLLIKKKK